MPVLPDPFSVCHPPTVLSVFSSMGALGSSAWAFGICWPLFPSPSSPANSYEAFSLPENPYLQKSFSHQPSRTYICISIFITLSLNAYVSRYLVFACVEQSWRVHTVLDLSHLWTHRAYSNIPWLKCSNKTTGLANCLMRKHIAIVGKEINLHL